jgi:hypothetical protein
LTFTAAVTVRLLVGDAGSGEVEPVQFHEADLVQVLLGLRHLHRVPGESRLVKKSPVSTPGRSVRTPCCVPPVFAPSDLSPPTRTVISGAVRSSM